MTDHSSHNHPATPAARAACRKSNGNPRTTRIEADGFNKNTPVAPIKMTGPVARRMARQAIKAEQMAEIRINRDDQDDPDVRAAFRQAGCVQVELHNNAHGGSCACGWVAV